MKNKEVTKCIVNIIKGQTDMSQTLYQIKKYGTSEDYEKTVSALHRNAFYKKRLSSLYTNRNVNDIFTSAYIPSLTFSSAKSIGNILKDVQFMVKFLLGYKNLISEFYNKKTQFEASYLSGNYQNAEYFLDEIYKEFGISFWYIEMRLLLLNEFDYDAYRTFYESLKKSAANDLVLTHIRLIKRRVNMRSSQIDYCQLYMNNFASDATYDDFNFYRAYVDFMYTESPAKLSESQLGNLAIMIHHFTLIDTVLFVERFLLHLVCVHEISECLSMYEEFKVSLNGNDDQRAQDYHTVKSLFCNKEYDSCCLKCEEYLTKHSDRFEVIDIYVKALLVLGRSVKINKSPLADMVNIILNCYLKKDGSSFGATFMDKSNQMLRSLSSFNGYYELLNIISNTMYVKSSMEHSYWDIMVRKRPFKNIECDILDHNYPSTGIVSCDWSYSFYKKTQAMMLVTQDNITEGLRRIRDKKSLSISNYRDFEGLDRLFYEEEIVIAFYENIEKKQYIQAIQIYVQVLLEDILLSTRFDTDLLSSYLPEGKCTPYLSDLSFFIYTATTDLNKQFADTLSQTLYDSYYAILSKYGFKVPSDFINTPIKNDKLLFKFLEFCCDDKILTQSPSDLYGKERLLEREKLYSFLFNCTRLDRFHSCLDRVRDELAEYNVRNTAQSTYLPKEKINTDWLTVEYDCDVSSAYDQLQGLSYEQIARDDNLFKIYKTMFIRCKEKYLIQVNKQLGTFIRHGVFINRIVEFLKKYDFFFTTGDESEEKEKIEACLFLQKIPSEDRISVFKSLQNNCLAFFQSLEGILESIYFTSQENHSVCTPLYFKSKDLNDRIRKLEKSDNDSDFICSIKILLDELVEESLPYMRKNVEARLTNTINEYFASIRRSIPAQYYTMLPFDDLMLNFPEEVKHIGEWFQVINDSRQKCNIDGYLCEQKNKYPEICFNLSVQNSTMRLSDLILLDIITENLIRNVELHSGFNHNYKQADTEIRIEIVQENDYVVIASKNRLNGINPESIQHAISKINQIMPSISSGMINVQKPITQNTEELSSSVEKHGVGLYNLGCIMYKTCKDSHIIAKYDEGLFFIQVDFCLGGCD